MIEHAPPAGPEIQLEATRRRDLLSAAAAVVLAVLAIYVVGYLLQRSVDPVDFHVYLDAAEEIAAGESPYPEYAYPPLSAIGAVPFTYVSGAVADFAVKALLMLGVLATLAVLGVRDWRCYALALLWPQMNAAVQTGNVTIPLGLAAALVWRFRDRPAPAGWALGTAVAAKFVLWPLWVWLAAARRYAAAAWAIVAGAVVTLVSWAVVDFGALIDYPTRLQQLDQDTTGKGYTLDTLAEDLGAGETTARLVMSAVAVGLLISVVIAARRGNETRAFVLAIGAALACSPILWLHYFALLLVPVAIVAPRLSWLWFVPMGMWWFGAGTGNGTTFEAFVVTCVVAATIALAARAAGASGAASSPTMSPVATRP